MKKFMFAVMAIVAISLASCGNGSTTATKSTADTTKVDSAKVKVDTTSHKTTDTAKAVKSTK